MAYDVEWSSEATADLDNAVTYLSSNLHDPRAASALFDQAEAATGIIASRPLALPRISDAYLARRGYRRAMAGDYLLFFRVVEERASIVNGEVEDRGEKNDGLVRVLRVFHAGQDYPSVIRHRA